MLARIYTATLIGLNPVRIEVEIDATQGLPGIILIGLPSKAVEEARERISAALQNCGIHLRAKRTIINLAPADIPKSGTALDLAIAVGLLRLYEKIQWNTNSTVFFGELSLDGSVKPVRGALPLVLAARAMGFSTVVFPKANSAEVQSVRNITLVPIAHLREYLAQKGKYTRRALPHSVPQTPQFSTQLQDIRGQQVAKRALEIAGAGRHNVLLVGPPGAGKSMLARALVSILPPLTESESLDVTRIYSVCGYGERGMQTHPPFRDPHHTTTSVGLLGGGNPVKPGELSLAHRGVLFLDELPEFSRYCIESLRQPLEEGTLRITRARGSVTFPAECMLIAAANPCPCGSFGSSRKPCSCTPHAREHYQHKLSGPILDRIDLHVPVDTVEISELSSQGSEGETSEQVRSRVVRARAFQHSRTGGKTLTNARLSNAQVQQLEYSNAAGNLLAAAGEKLQLTARGYFKVLKVARTIADLDHAECVQAAHIAEALQYRPAPTQ